MIKHAIQNNPDARLVKVVRHKLKILIRAKPTVELRVIARIVPMRIRFENRRKINSVRTELLNMTNPVIYLQNTM